MGMPSRRTNNFPENGRGLSHVTPTIFGIRSNISLKLLELETSNLIHGFVWQCRAGAQINFGESGRSLGHVTPTIFWQYGRLSQRQLGFLLKVVFAYSSKTKRQFSIYLGIRIVLHYNTIQYNIRLLKLDRMQADNTGSGLSLIHI